MNKTISKFYDLLDHEENTEIRAVELDENFKSKGIKGHYTIKSKEEFVNKIKELNGKYNLYAGLNEREEQGTKAKDVKSVKNIFLDIDCKKKPASQEVVKEAEKVADNIINKIQEKTLKRGTKIYSGNGYQLLFKIPTIEITDENRKKIENKIQQFQKDIINKFSTEKVKIDQVGDLPRIIRITGTTNIKGGKTSEFIEIHEEENERLKDYILSLEPASESVKVGEIETSLREILEKDTKAKSIFEGNTEGFESRSEAELSLVCKLIKLGLDKNQIFQVMASSGTGKWSEAPLSYRNLTYSKALQKVTKEGNIGNETTPFILDESEIPQRIDHAVGRIEIGDKSLRYYGAKINEKVEKKDKKGNPYTITQKGNALILENGQIISKENNQGINFDFQTEMTLAENRWELESIKNFCKNTINKENYTLKKTYEEFKKRYDESMVFDNKTWYKLNAIWDLTTYFQDRVEKFLMFKLEGISGTAKSKKMKISANLSFNGKKFLCPTPANFFRYRNHNKATLFIEEAEKLFDTSKKQNIGDSELVEYLNGSYEKGNTVPRQDDKNINITLEFDPAGFTQIGSINPLKGALEKRSIPLHMIKAPGNDSRNEFEPPTEKAEAYKKCRNMAYISGLLYYKEFEKALENVENNYGLKNRQWLVAKPLIAMAKTIDSKLEKEIGDFLSKMFEVRDDVDSDSWEVRLADLLVGVFCTKKQEDFVSTEEIKEIFKTRIDEKYQNISSTKIGIMMSKLGFAEYKSNPTGNQRGYTLHFYEVCKILIRQEYLTKENILNKVSEVSECQYSDEDINKWYSDTFMTPDTYKEKDKDKSDTSDRQDTYFRGGGVTNQENETEQRGKIKALEKMDFYDFNGNRVYLEQGKEYLSEDFDPKTFQTLTKSDKVELIK